MEWEAGPEHAGLVWFPPQVQSIEFTQIEMKVMEGLQFGNECLNKMHQVGPHGARGREEGQSSATRGGLSLRPHVCPGHQPGGVCARQEHGKASHYWERVTV